MGYAVKIACRSVLAGLLSLAATMAVVLSAVPVLGGRVEGAGLLMSILCPLLIAPPCYAVQLIHSERLRRAKDELSRKNTELEKLYRKLEQQSRTDQLTGLLNRGAFFQSLQEASQRGTSGTLLYADVDHFKSVNDRYGHATGDRVLSAVSSLLASRLEACDFAGRVGGEEFAVFLATVTGEDARNRTEALRIAVKDMVVLSGTAERVALTISIGTAACADHFDPDAAIDFADKKLYHAKRNGRNQISM